MKYSIVLFLSLLLVSCNEEIQKDPKPAVEKNSEKQSPKVQPKKEKKATELKSSRITDDNVEKRLLAYGKENPETVVDIYTSKGKIRVKLYKDTPLHRANFIMMAKMGYFNGTVFTRVVPNFMAQAGSAHNSSHMEKKKVIGKYTIPNEIDVGHIHKRGALGAARSYSSNPTKRSNPFSFYFVEGMTYNDLTLDHYEKENGYKFSQSQREYYLKNPGAAHIDGQHTVFGEIIDGYEVVPKLTAVERDSQDWPHIDIYVEKVEVVE